MIALLIGKPEREKKNFEFRTRGMSLAISCSTRHLYRSNNKLQYSRIQKIYFQEEVSKFWNGISINIRKLQKKKRKRNYKKQNKTNFVY